MKTPDPKEIRRKIYAALSVCPVLTPSQLQIGVGTNIPPKLWRPVLNEMIFSGVVCRREIELQEIDCAPGEDKLLHRSTFHSVLCLAHRGTSFQVVLTNPITIGHNIAEDMT